ncbi:dodecenoyl-CoA isomerase, partial [Rhizophlyctis rosea]
MSSPDPSLLTITYPEDQPGLAILTLHRHPVNSMNLALWQALSSCLTQLEANPKVRSLIFRSGLSRPIFTAGNDINELHAKRTTRERYIKFWITKNQFLARLLRTRLTTGVCVKGACPAAGTCLAMCCDVRVGTEDVTMGLNEVALGISVPVVWTKLLARI